MTLSVLAAMTLPAFSAEKAGVKTEKRSSIARGEYLTTILGCGGCHTEGALEGRPYGRSLAGSRIGIAYTDPSESPTPGVVFPANLTPHKSTGLGRWSKAEIARAIRGGINHQGGEVISVMPWMNYSLLSDEDTNDIASFLQSLPKIDYKIPENVALGEPIKHRYLRIGVYSFEPFESTNTESDADPENQTISDHQNHQD